jgi:hypothetical protein
MLVQQTRSLPSRHIRWKQLAHHVLPPVGLILAFPAPSMCGLLQEIRTAFSAHCLTIQHKLATSIINRIYSNSAEYFPSLNMQADGRTVCRVHEQLPLRTQEVPGSILGGVN